MKHLVKTYHLDLISDSANYDKDMVFNNTRAIVSNTIIALVLVAIITLLRAQNYFF